MSILKKIIRSDLLENFKPYSSAASEMGKKQGAIYLNANENPYPFNGLEGYERYDVQQPPALIAAMAKNYKTSPEYIVATRGSDESIDLLIRIFCQAGKDAFITCPPTFAMYNVYGNLQGAKNIEVPLLEDNYELSLDVDNIIKTAKNPDNHVKMVFICCPNSPSATLLSIQDIKKVLTELEGHAAVIVDEAYIDFTTQKSFVSELENHPNLLVCRTLSKVHALAGERCGGTVCADIEFMKFMRGCLAPYPVPKSVAENAVEALRQAEDKQDTMVKDIITERTRLITALRSSDDVEHVYPSETNFILVKFKSLDLAQGLLQKALQNNIIIRDISKQKYTENCLRISVGNAEDTQKLIDLI